MADSRSATPSVSESVRRKEVTDVEKAPIEEKDPNASTAQTADEPISPFHPSQFPDGGTKAWLCLLGGACCLFVSFGWLNCIGVFQSYYETHQLRNHTSSQIAWISSLQIFLMFFAGIFVGFFYDNHGPKPLILFGSFFHVFGLMMTSLCTEYYQFILAQGICSPLGLNCIFNAALASIPTWFHKKRGMAYGIVTAGSGLGGVLFPIMASHLIPEVGFAWTMRIFAFMFLALCVVAFFTVSSRLPPKKRNWNFKVFLEPFEDLRYTMLLISSFLFFMGIFIPINFVELQALRHGMSTRLAGYLLSILNACSILGRLVPGALADKFGPYNMQTFMAFFAAILTLALALPASSNAAIISFAAFYGFASGGYVSVLPAQLARISKVEQIGIRTGVLFALTAFAGLIGNPVAGLIIADDHGDFKTVNVFAGVMMLAGGVMFLLTRMLYADWKVLKRA